MKKLVLTIFFAFIFLGGIAAANSDLLEISDKVEFCNKEPRPCTVTIKGVFDGIEVDIEVTVDASWFECTFLKSGVKKAIEESLKQ